MAEELIFEKRPDGVALITLNRPDSLNALSAAMYTGIASALADCERDRSVRCIALTGAGRAFCSGGDVRGMAAATSGAAEGDGPARSTVGLVDQWSHDLRDTHMSTSLRLYTIAKPVVAIVNGVAAGAGMGLALGCDIRLCSDRARFVTAFRNVGLAGDFGISYFLPRLVGSGRARELMFTAEPVEAARAVEIGLANRVFAHDSLMDEALAFCAALASGPTAAIGHMKQNLNAAETSSLVDVLEREAFYQRFLRFSTDHREASRAFVEKRPAEFIGE